MAQFTSAGRRPLWIALLVVASVGFSLDFSCAVPLAAFAAIAALTPKPPGCLCGRWRGLARQSNRRLRGASLSCERQAPWPGAPGLAPWLFFRRSARNGSKTVLRKAIWWPRIAAFLAAFAVYEGSLFAISLALASGVSDYTPAIVWRISRLQYRCLRGAFPRCIASAYSRVLPKCPVSPRANGVLNAPARPVQDLPRSFRAVVRLVLRRALLWRASATQVPQLLPAIFGKA